LFRLEPNNRYIDTAREKASRFTPGKIKELGFGSLFYAGLLFAKGIGLSLLKGWALRIPDRWVMSPKRLVISTTYKTRVALENPCKKRQGIVIGQL
jgi:Predicted membrane protein (DUF2127)